MLRKEGAPMIASANMARRKIVIRISTSKIFEWCNAYFIILRFPGACADIQRIRYSGRGLVRCHDADRHKSTSYPSITMPDPRRHSIFPLGTAKIIFETPGNIVLT